MPSHDYEVSMFCVYLRARAARRRSCHGRCHAPPATANTLLTWRRRAGRSSRWQQCRSTSNTCPPRFGTRLQPGPPAQGGGRLGRWEGQWQLAAAPAPGPQWAAAGYSRPLRSWSDRWAEWLLLVLSYIMPALLFVCELGDGQH